MISRWDYNCDFQTLEEEINGTLIDISDCMMAEQAGIMMGDSLDGLNAQIQRQVGTSNGPFDVMIIMKEVE